MAALEEIRESEISLPDLMRPRHIFSYVFFLAVLIGSFVFGNPLQNFEIWMYAVAGVVIGLGAFSYGFGTFKRLQFINSTPTSKIRSMPKGNVELEGEALPVDSPIKSPFTGSECLLCEYEVLKKPSTSQSFVPVASGRVHSLFKIDDGTGQAYVDPGSSAVKTRARRSEFIGSDEEPDERIVKYAEQSDVVDVEDVKTSEPVKIEEKLLLPEASTYVFGFAEKETIDGKSEVVVREGGAPLFYISTLPREHIVSDWTALYKVVILLSLLLTPFSLLIALMAAGAL